MADATDAPATDVTATSPDTRALRRHVQHARRRHAWWLALAGATAANAALAIALHAGRSSTPARAAPPPPPSPAPQLTFVFRDAPAAASAATPAPAPAPAPEPRPPPPPPAFADLGPCPAPYTARTPGAFVPPQPPDAEELHGFAVSPTDTRLLAAWSREHLLVSRDGGRRWSRVLDGPGGMIDATFDCHGRAIALRHGFGLGIRDGARETWRHVPFLDAGTGGVDDAGELASTNHRRRLAGGGRAIAVFGVSGDDTSRGLALVSDDLGVGWRTADLGYYESGAFTHAWTGDTLHVVIPIFDCSYASLRYTAIGPDGTTAHELERYAQQLALTGGAVVALDGCHADGDATGEPGLCRWTAARGWRPLGGMQPPATDDGEPTYPYLIDGPVDVVIDGNQLHTLRANGLGPWRPWPRDWTALTTDGAGRVYALDVDGQLVRR